MITRDNYEEFFLLYIDNELPVTDRQAVEEWVGSNPDLKEEWEALLSCRLQPSQQMVFRHKETLLRQESAAPGSTLTGDIGEHNYEEYFLSFIDNELNARDRAAVEAFARAHPSEQQELDQLLLTVSSPDASICFPDKESLYRNEKDRKPLPFWIRIAAAAAVLGIAALLLPMTRHKETPSVAGKPPVHKKDAPTVTTPAIATLYPIEDRYTAKTGDSVKGDSVKGDSVKTTIRQKIHRLPVIDQPAEQETKDITVNNPQSNVNPPPPNAYNQRPAENIQERPGPVVGNKTVLNAEDKPRDLAVVSPKDIPVAPSSFATQALLQEEADDNDKVILTAEPASPAKSKLRGLFRKVTRTFGKTADRDNDGQREVLIGAFQVAIK